MNDTIRKMKQKKVLLLALAFPLFSPISMHTLHKADNVCMEMQQGKTITGVKQINPTTVEVMFSDNQRMTFDFYGENIFRMFQDPNGGILRAPEAKPEAQILVDNPRRNLSPLTLTEEGNTVSISTNKIRLELDKNTSLLKITNLVTGKVAFEEVKPVLYDKGKTILTLKENPGEYFYGGGVQNGRFSHKGKAIAIENQNSWTDGGYFLPRFIGLPTGTVSCGIRSNKVNMISAQLKKAACSFLMIPITWMPSAWSAMALCLC